MIFPGQRENENVLLVVRKHAIVYVRVIFIYMVMLIVPAIVFLVIWSRFYTGGPDGATIMMIFASEYFLFVLLFQLYSLLAFQEFF